MGECDGAWEPPKESQEAQNVGEEHHEHNPIKLSLFDDLALGRESNEHVSGFPCPFSHPGTLNFGKISLSYSS